MAEEDSEAPPLVDALFPDNEVVDSEDDAAEEPMAKALRWAEEIASHRLTDEEAIGVAQVWALAGVKNAIDGLTQVISQTATQ